MHFRCCYIVQVLVYAIIILFQSLRTGSGTVAPVQFIMHLSVSNPRGRGRGEGEGDWATHGNLTVTYVYP